MNFKAGRGKTGAWSAYGNLVNQWLQVDLGRYSIVTGIATQGRNAYPQWVTLYELQCSEDGVTFVYYKAPGQSSPKVSYAQNIIACLLYKPSGVILDRIKGYFPLPVHLFSH